MADPYYSEYSLSPVLKLKTYFLTEIRTAARISLVCHTPRHVLEVFRWFAEHEEETGLRVMTGPRHAPRPICLRLRERSRRAIAVP